jgi:hypothetical protein
MVIYLSPAGESQSPATAEQMIDNERNQHPAKHGSIDDILARFA